MNQETAAKGQLIELRAKGWSYEKIARHTGIDQKKLLAWGIRYKDCIDAEREINRAALEESRRLRASATEQPTEQQSHFYNVDGYPDQSVPKSKTQRPKSRVSERSPLPRGEGQGEGQTSAGSPPEGAAQESYFHNLKGRGSSAPASVRRTRKRPCGKTCQFKTKFRKLLRHPVVRAAIRYAVFKH
jgi:hypothetical protein